MASFSARLKRLCGFVMLFSAIITTLTIGGMLNNAPLLSSLFLTFAEGQSIGGSIALCDTNIISTDRAYTVDASLNYYRTIFTRTCFFMGELKISTTPANRITSNLNLMLIETRTNRLTLNLNLGLGSTVTIMNHQPYDVNNPTPFTLSNGVTFTNGASMKLLGSTFGLFTSHLLFTSCASLYISKSAFTEIYFSPSGGFMNSASMVMHSSNVVSKVLGTSSSQTYAMRVGCTVVDSLFELWNSTFEGDINTAVCFDNAASILSERHGRGNVLNVTSNTLSLRTTTANINTPTAINQYLLGFLPALDSAPTKSSILGPQTILTLTKNTFTTTVLNSNIPLIYCVSAGAFVVHSGENKGSGGRLVFQTIVSTQMYNSIPASPASLRQSLFGPQLIVRNYANILSIELFMNATSLRSPTLIVDRTVRVGVVSLNATTPSTYTGSSYVSDANINIERLIFPVIAGSAFTPSSGITLYSNIEFRSSTIVIGNMTIPRFSYMLSKLSSNANMLMRNVTLSGLDLAIPMASGSTFMLAGSTLSPNGLVIRSGAVANSNLIFDSNVITSTASDAVAIMSGFTMSQSVAVGGDTASLAIVGNTLTCYPVSGYYSIDWAGQSTGGTLLISRNRALVGGFYFAGKMSSANSFLNISANTVNPSSSAATYIFYLSSTIATGAKLYHDELNYYSGARPFSVNIARTLTSTATETANVYFVVGRGSSLGATSFTGTTSSIATLYKDSVVGLDNAAASSLSFNFDYPQDLTMIVRSVTLSSTLTIAAVSMTNTVIHAESLTMAAAITLTGSMSSGSSITFVSLSTTSYLAMGMSSSCSSTATCLFAMRSSSIVVDDHALRFTLALGAYTHIDLHGSTISSGSNNGKHAISFASGSPSSTASLAILHCTLIAKDTSIGAGDAFSLYMPSSGFYGGMELWRSSFDGDGISASWTSGSMAFFNVFQNRIEQGDYSGAARSATNSVQGCNTCSGFGCSLVGGNNIAGISNIGCTTSITRCSNMVTSFRANPNAATVTSTSATTVPSCVAYPPINTQLTTSPLRSNQKTQRVVFTSANTNSDTGANFGFSNSSLGDVAFSGPANTIPLSLCKSRRDRLATIADVLMYPRAAPNTLPTATATILNTHYDSVQQCGGAPSLKADLASLGSLELPENFTIADDEKRRLCGMTVEQSETISITRSLLVHETRTASVSRRETQTKSRPLPVTKTVPLPTTTTTTAPATDESGNTIVPAYPTDASGNTIVPTTADNSDTSSSTDGPTFTGADGGGGSVTDSSGNTIVPSYETDASGNTVLPSSSATSSGGGGDPTTYPTDSSGNTILPIPTYPTDNSGNAITPSFITDASGNTILPPTTFETDVSGNTILPTPSGGGGGGGSDVTSYPTDNSGNAITPSYVTDVSGNTILPPTTTGSGGGGGSTTTHHGPSYPTDSSGNAITPSFITDASGNTILPPTTDVSGNTILPTTTGSGGGNVPTDSSGNTIATTYATDASGHTIIPTNPSVTATTFPRMSTTVPVTTTTHHCTAVTGGTVGSMLPANLTAYTDDFKVRDLGTSTLTATFCSFGGGGGSSTLPTTRSPNNNNDNKNGGRAVEDRAARFPTPRSNGVSPSSIAPWYATFNMTAYAHGTPSSSSSPTSPTNETATTAAPAPREVVVVSVTASMRWVDSDCLTLSMDVPPSQLYLFENGAVGNMSAGDATRYGFCPASDPTTDSNAFAVFGAAALATLRIYPADQRPSNAGDDGNGGAASPSRHYNSTAFTGLGFALFDAQSIAVMSQSRCAPSPQQGRFRNTGLINPVTLWEDKDREGGASGAVVGIIVVMAALGAVFFTAALIRGVVLHSSGRYYDDTQGIVPTPLWTLTKRSLAHFGFGLWCIVLLALHPGAVFVSIRLIAGGGSDAGLGVVGVLLLLAVPLLAMPPFIRAFVTSAWFPLKANVTAATIRKARLDLSGGAGMVTKAQFVNGDRANLVKTKVTLDAEEDEDDKGEGCIKALSARLVQFVSYMLSPVGLYRTQEVGEALSPLVSWRVKQPALWALLPFASALINAVLLGAYGDAGDNQSSSSSTCTGLYAASAVLHAVLVAVVVVVRPYTLRGQNVMAALALMLTTVALAVSAAAASAAGDDAMGYTNDGASVVDSYVSTLEILLYVHSILTLLRLVLELWVLYLSSSFKQAVAACVSSEFEWRVVGWRDSRGHHMQRPSGESKDAAGDGLYWEEDKEMGLLLDDNEQSLFLSNKVVKMGSKSRHQSSQHAAININSEEAGGVCGTSANDTDPSSYQPINLLHSRSPSIDGSGDASMDDLMVGKHSKNNTNNQKQNSSASSSSSADLFGSSSSDSESNNKRAAVVGGGGVARQGTKDSMKSSDEDLFNSGSSSDSSDGAGSPPPPRSLGGAQKKNASDDFGAGSSSDDAPPPPLPSKQQQQSSAATTGRPPPPSSSDSDSADSFKL